MKERFAPFLREAGLRGSGGRFTLASETYWLLLGFQKSTSSDRHEVRFTVNVSAIRRDVWDAQRAATPYLGRTPQPATLYGPWAEQQRIGMLTPSGLDKWWRLRPDRNVDAFVADVLADLRQYAIPWLKATRQQ